MQNIPPSNSKNARLERISLLRGSMKTINLLTQKSTHLENKFNLRRERRIRSGKCNSFEESQTNESENSENSLDCGLNAFSKKYKLLEKLGEGANACVYRCQHLKSGRIYAAKKIKFQEEHILDLKRNFINLKELKHPSIIKYRALYLDLSQHCAFLVMECFHKPSLSEAAIKTEQQLQDVVKQLVKALQYLHNRNICHRDIKPENILYCPLSKTVKIIDFGISKKTYQRGVRRDMLTMIGTHYYQAPEVYLGGGYDERIDLWALGITVFKMITGHTPFESEYHSSTIQKITKCELSFNDPAWSKFSTFAKDFVSKLLKRREERMSLKDASNHIWLSEPSAIKRSKSHKVELHVDFHDEMNNKLSHAISKEESTKLVRKLTSKKKIELLSKSQFDLSDSETEEEVSPSKNKGIPFSQVLQI